MIGRSDLPIDAKAGQIRIFTQWFDIKIDVSTRVV
jgi:hypothetical protein